MADLVSPIIIFFVKKLVISKKISLMASIFRTRQAYILIQISWKNFNLYF